MGALLGQRIPSLTHSVSILLLCTAFLLISGNPGTPSAAHAITHISAGPESRSPCRAERASGSANLVSLEMPIAAQATSYTRALVRAARVEHAEYSRTPRIGHAG